MTDKTETGKQVGETTPDLAPPSPQGPTDAAPPTPTSSDDPLSLDGLTIPNTAESLRLTPWTETSYGPTLVGSGARKCADSGIAPLVARARGLYTERDPKALAKRLNVEPTSKQGRQMRSVIKESEAMVMPWMTGADGVRYFDDPPSDPDVDIIPSNVQYRPAPENLVPGKNGKMIKYVNMVDSAIVISIHPSVPQSWIVDSTSPIFFTEGMLKADSALTAVLRDAGVSDEDLALVPGETLFEARARLKDLMETLPVNKRVATYAFLSVSTWRNRPEWNSIRLKGRKVLVAFDGDVGKNPQVHAQARLLFTMTEKAGADPYLIDLSGIVVEDGSKIGVDDFLAGYGSWGDLEKLITDELPPNPGESRVYAHGDLRCDWDEAAMMQFVDENATGAGTSTYWVPKWDYVARRISREQQREVTDHEEVTGRIDPDEENEADALLEFLHRDANGQVHRSLVKGPEKILLGMGPDQWVRSDKVRITGQIASALDFPPERKDAAAFLNAMKMCRVDEIRNRPRWDHMGWVPTDNGRPVFIVGKQVIDAKGDNSDAASTAVSDATVSSFGRFGVIMPKNADDARQALRKMLDAYRPADDNDEMRIWNDPSHAAIVVAAALRPTVPLPPHLSVTLTGLSGGGKALPMDALLPVPASKKFRKGWARNDELEVGDLVFGPNGEPTPIRAFSQVWDDEDMYELTLSDGQVVRASGNHIFNVSSAASRKSRKKPPSPDSATIAQHRSLTSRASRMSSGDAASLAFIAAELGMDVADLERIAAAHGLPHHEAVTPGGLAEVYPYAEVLYAVAEQVLHGSKATPLVASKSVAAMVAEGVKSKFAIPTSRMYAPERQLPTPGSTPPLTDVDPASNPFGLPYGVLRANRETREKALSDVIFRVMGVPPRGMGSFNFQVRNAYDVTDVVELGRSLGYVVRVEPGAELTKVHVSNEPWLHIEAIQKVDQEPSRCLQVEHPTGCFLVDGFVVTHNSWTSARIMDFWSARPGAWGVDQLPGSASDTRTAMEMAIARTPIWVADDVAPNAADPNAADRARGAVAETIRNVYNRQGRGRATSSMGVQRKYTPRAVFISTMEDSLLDDSVINRTFEVPVLNRLLNPSTVPTKALEAMTNTECPQAIVTAYLIQMFARRVDEIGWDKVRAECLKYKEKYRSSAQKVIGDSKSEGSARHAENVADLSLSLWALQTMCDELHTNDLKARVASMMNDILDNAKVNHKERAQNNVGATFIHALASQLKSGQCYVDALGIDGQPVPESTNLSSDEIDAINRALGWSRNASGEDRRPIGRVRVGGLFEEHGEYHVMFDTTAAYQSVRRTSSVIASRSEPAIWRSVLESKQSSPHMVPAKPDWKHRRTRNRVTEVGIAVPLWRLLGLQERAFVEPDEE